MIEDTLIRIAVALEKIAAGLEPANSVVTTSVQSEPLVPTPPQQVPPAPPAQQVPQPPAQQVSAATLTTAAELQTALAAEWTRLGQNREPIDRVMREQFAIQSINELRPDQYDALLNAVRQVQA